MNIDFKSAIGALSAASPSHLALASFILLPIVLDYWLQAILKLFPDPSTCGKVSSIIFLLLCYVVIIVWMAIESSKKSKLANQRDLILGRITSNNWSSISFDSLRKTFGDEFTDETIHRVIQTFPKTLRLVRMPKDGNSIKKSYRPGVGLVSGNKSVSPN